MKKVKNKFNKVYMHINKKEYGNPYSAHISHLINLDWELFDKLLDKYKKETHSFTLSEEKTMRCISVFKFIVKVGIKYLPKVQRKIFYAVWVKNGGEMKKGFSMKDGTVNCKSTNYINYHKAMHNLIKILKNMGYYEYLIKYLNEEV